jgi:hypothetical protein
MRDSAQKSNSQAGLLLPRPKAIRGEAAPLGRKEAVPGRTEGIPSWAEGNPSQSEGNPNRAEGNPSRAEGIPNVCPSVKSKSFNGLRSTPAGGLGVTLKTEKNARPLTVPADSNSKGCGSFPVIDACYHGFRISETIYTSCRDLSGGLRKPPFAVDLGEYEDPVSGSALRLLPPSRNGNEAGATNQGARH